MSRRLMKRFLFYIVVLCCIALQSCVEDTPWNTNGSGALNIFTEIRSDVKISRSDDGEDMTALRNKCVVYLENGKGVIRKFKGVDNIPSDIKLRTGDYVAEAWTGDSVSASFDMKFYRGFQTFSIRDNETTSLVLKCNIANVIVSVNPSALDLNIKNLKITFGHSRASLEFDEANIKSSKGYFMMPNADKNLFYRVEGENASGKAFVKEGELKNVERAHEYVMSLTATAPDNNLGGALISIAFEDIPVIEETVHIFGRPTISGSGFNIANQIVGTPDLESGVRGAFADKVVCVRGYDELKRVELRPKQNFEESNHPLKNCNLVSQDESEVESLRVSLGEMGISWQQSESTDAETGRKIVELRINFAKRFFDELEPRLIEYLLGIYVEDGVREGNSAERNLRIANMNEAIEVKLPVNTADAPDWERDPLAVRTTSAQLSGYLYDAEAAQNYGIRYRKQGEQAWTCVPVTKEMAARAAKVSAQRKRSKIVTRSATLYTVNVTNLEPGTTYEFSAYCDGFDGFDVLSFTTESEFIIPNASFEEWSSYKASTLLGTKTVIFPGSGSEPSFWDSGNEGAATGNIVLTDKSTDMVHSGNYSAKLKTAVTMGIPAAGNIFFGDYVRTDGTNGVLSFGRPYNGSHPSMLRLWANYRPGSSVTVRNDLPEGAEVVEGGPDVGQVYVALTTEPVEIRTNASDRKLFEPMTDPVVVAYGQMTWSEAFGADGKLQKVEIPIVYNERAKSVRPKYLVIVVSASKYGDYFAAAAGSTCYIDDFEFIYE